MTYDKRYPKARNGFAVTSIDGTVVKGGGKCPCSVCYKPTRYTSLRSMLWICSPECLRLEKEEYERLQVQSK